MLPRSCVWTLHFYLSVPFQADEDANTEDCTYNSFQYWRVPLPELDLSLLEDASAHSKTKDKSKASSSDAMETWRWLVQRGLLKAASSRLKHGNMMGTMWCSSANRGIKNRLLEMHQGEMRTCQGCPCRAIQALFILFFPLKWKTV